MSCQSDIKIEQLQKRVDNLEFMLHTLWTLHKDFLFFHPNLQKHTQNLMEKHFYATLNISGKEIPHELQGVPNES